jgi:hypothetical protein
VLIRASAPQFFAVVGEGTLRRPVGEPGGDAPAVAPPCSAPLGTILQAALAPAATAELIAQIATELG